VISVLPQGAPDHEGRNRSAIPNPVDQFAAVIARRPEAPWRSRKQRAQRLHLWPMDCFASLAMTGAIQPDFVLERVSRLETALLYLQLPLKHDFYENGVGYEFRPLLMS
jgi:hypothetical protein